jgi:hypothetical protein
VVFGEIIFKGCILRFLVSKSGNLVKNSFEDLGLWESFFFLFYEFLSYDLLVLLLDFIDDDFLGFKEKILNFFCEYHKNNDEEEKGERRR